jgi:hypothetical protein
MPANSDVNDFGRTAFLLYLNFAIVLPIAAFQFGLLRVAVLVLFAAYLLVRIGSSRIAAIESRLLDLAPGLHALLLGAAPLAVFVVSLGSPNKVRIWEAMVVCALIGVLIWRSLTNGREAGTRFGRLGFGILLIALTVPALNLASGMLVPKLSDVATTTIDAVRVVGEGHNPYAAARLDPLGAVNAHAPGYGGYKYLPLMIGLHAPFVAAFGPMGVLVCNLAMIALLCAMVQATVRGPEARLIGLAVLLVTPELMESSLAMGFNDLPGTLLVLAAFLVSRGLDFRAALLSGLLLGCSVSCKLMPAAVAITLLFPPRHWLAYGLGVGMGLLPTLAFLAWDPAAFLRNVILFNLVRLPDPTSWRLFAPLWLGKAASLGAMSLWLGTSGWLAWRSWRNGQQPLSADPVAIELRLKLYVLLVLVVTMAGATAHDDYMIWWMPALVLLLAREADLQESRREGALQAAPSPMAGSERPQPAG